MLCLFQNGKSPISILGIRGGYDSYWDTDKEDKEAYSLDSDEAKPIKKAIEVCISLSRGLILHYSQLRKDLSLLNKFA